MDIAVLTIKTSIPPLDAKTVQRERILQHVSVELSGNRGWTRRLTLVCAPAGFGKTTLTRQMIQDKEAQSAWFSLDERDNDRQRFWSYLITALQSVRPHLGKGTLETIRSSALGAEPAESEVLLTPLLNDLFLLEEPCFLILDDYHLIEQSQIHQDMVFFLENLPPSVTGIITTRSEPPWPLARWRARQMVLEIRQKELTFSREEASRLLSSSGERLLSSSQLQSLYDKTGGWAAGLQLASCSLTQAGNAEAFIRSFTGSSRHIFHFLTDEVFSCQPEPVREFLVKTSVLNRFSPSLCCILTGRDDSREILSRLERGNVFLEPLDHDGFWYRYHPLFADLLQYKLKHSFPDEIPLLYERASRWFLEAGDPGEAVRLALKGNHQELSARILHEHIEDVLQSELSSEGPALLIQCLDRLPEKMLKQFPRLIAHKAWLDLIHKGRDTAAATLKLAEELPDGLKPELYGELSIVRAYCHIYDHQMPQAVGEAQRAMQLLSLKRNYWWTSAAVISGDARLFAGNPKDAYPYYLTAYEHNRSSQNHYLAISNGFKTATALYYRGKLSEAQELTRSLLQSAKQEGFSRVTRVGLLWTLLGELLREQGSLEEASRCIERGLYISRAETPSYSWNCLFSTALRFSQGQYRQALLPVEEIESIHREAALPSFITLPAACWKARIHLHLGDPGKAREIMKQTGIDEYNKLSGGEEWGALVYPRIIIEEVLQGKGSTQDLLRSRTLLEEIEHRAREGENLNVLMEALLIRTHLEETAGEQKQAEACRRESLRTGNARGYYQRFIDEKRDPVTGRKIQAGGIPDKAYERRVLQGNRSSSSAASQQLAEDLSRRELEVLALLSRGLSNQEISDTIFLSVGTVKWHTSNIYGKLGVRSRTEAVAVARTMQLL